MRIVVKVGTSTLAHPGGRLNIRNVEELVKVLSDLKNAGHEIILVSSGAIGMGIGKLNMDRSHMDMPAKQAAAAVGQCELMHTYDTLFLKYSHTVGQILITSEDIEDSERRSNFQNTMKTLLKFGALPVVNENDTVATTEINSVGDNDTLGAIIAKTIDADILILMSDIDGLFTADPNRDPDARLIETVEEITKEIEAFAGDACSELGTGGMATKIGAAQMVTESGCDMVIINGNYPDKLYDIVEGKSAGTLFRARR
ncbi:MAG: glutamate 5-kinase [Firmicutes bacterium]|nr:glutamate 5-kinase [Bacillota bacterium]MDY6174401.1 glutamate 5-kinase [Lentihominibacter sp.]